MSNLKLKGHHRRKQPRPYERRTDLMSRVRSWLTPSAWWTTPSHDDRGQDSCPSTPDSSPYASGGHQLEPTTSSFVSSRPFHMEGMESGSSIGIGTGPTCSIGMETGPSVGMGTGPSAGIGTGPSIEIRTGMGTGPSTEMGSGMELGPLDQSRESEESWVAEASDGEEEANGLPATVRTPAALGVRVNQKNMSSKTPSQQTSSRPSYSGLSRDLLEPMFRDSIAQPPSTNLMHPVGRVTSGKHSINSNKITSSAATFSSRLCSTHPLTTSTPQLSPVHEDNVGQPDTSVTTREQPQSTLPRSRPPSRSHLTPSFNVTPFKTHLHTTEDSLSRSPFLSPFYSGRTSFGGVASTQRTVRGKRARTSTTPPTLLTVRHSVRARPAHPPVTMATTQVHCVASQTAKKIMETLECLSSPLTDARRLPMRPLATTTEIYQPSKRRRGNHHVLSPPPVTPLHTHSHTNTPMIIPNEKTISRQTITQTNTGTPELCNSKSNNLSLQSVSKTSQSSAPSTATVTPPGFTPAASSTPQVSLGSIRFSAPSLTPPTSLGSIRFSAPSITPPTSLGSTRFSAPSITPPTSLGSTRFFAPSITPPTSLGSIRFSAPSITPPTSLGSIRFSAPSITPPTSLGDTKVTAPIFTPPTIHHESPPEPTKPIGFKPLFHATKSTITGGKVRSKRSGGHYHLSDDEEPSNPMALPPPVPLTLGSGGKLPTFSFTSDIKSIPLPAVMTSKVTMATSSTPFSFTSPKAVTVQASTAMASSDQSKPSFSFSVPKNCSLTAPYATLATTTPFTAKVSMTTPLTAKVAMATPLVAMVPMMTPLRAKVAMTTPLASKVAMTTPPPLKNMSVVDALKRPEFQPLGKVKGHEVVDLTGDDDDGVSAETPPSTKPLTQPPSTVKPLTQTPSTVKPLTQPPSTTKPLTQFLPPADSWSCDACLVNNKPSDKKCIACGTAKPGEQEQTQSKLPLGNQIKLGAGLSLPSTIAGGVKLGAGLSLPSTTAGGVKLGAGLSLPSTAGGVKLGAGLSLPAGGVKLGAGLSLPSTTAGGVKLGTGLSLPSTTASGVKLGAGLSLPSTAGGVKLGAGLSLPSTAGGVKLGAGLSLPSTAGGVKLGAGLSLPSTAGGVKLGAGLSLPSTAGGVKLGAGLSLPSTTAGGMKLGAGLSLPSTTAGGMKLGGNQLPVKAPTSKIPVEVEPLKPLAQFAPLKPLAQFAPAPGSWTCDTCMVNNKPGASSCVACSSPKPGGGEEKPSGGELKHDGLTDTKIISQPSESQKTESKAKGESKLELSGGLKPLPQFAPPPGSWECETCMVSNKAEDDKCAACASLKPGAKDNSKQSSGGSLQLGAAGGLKLGSTLSALKPMAGQQVGLGSGGFQLGGGLKLSGDGMKKGTLSALKQPQISSGGLQLGTQGSSGGLQLRVQGSSGGLQLGTQVSSGALQLGTQISSGGLQLGTQFLGGGLQLGTQVSSSGLQLGTQVSGSGGLLLGKQPPSSGLQLGMHGSSGNVIPLGFGQKQQQEGAAQNYNTNGGDVKAPNMSINFGMPRATVAPATVMKTTAVNLALTGASTNAFIFSQGQKQSEQQKPISSSQQLSFGSGLPVKPSLTFAPGQQPSSDSKPMFVFSAAKDTKANSPFSAGAMPGGFVVKTDQPSLMFGEQSLGQKPVGGQGTTLFGTSQQNVFQQEQAPTANFKFHAVQSHTGKGEDVPKLNFGGPAPNLTFGQTPQANIGLSNMPQGLSGPPNFPFGQSQSTGSPVPNSGVQNPSTNGFNFNANAGINFNFTAGNPDVSSAAKFVGHSSDPSVANRIIKKAVRRRRQ